MKVTLKRVKGISELSFEIPDPGVWVITGLNGAGKSSLFGALFRIGEQNAFQKYYRTGSLLSTVDRYADASVEYEIGRDVVTYSYGGSRWRASPKRNANLLDQSPYRSVHFLEANAQRIEPYANEVRANRLKNSSAQMRDFLESVLADSKWQGLVSVTTTKGRSQRAYLIPHIVQGRKSYFSERSFSLGELCVLKLAVRLLEIPDGSLVLIDEVEMALHPQAQVRLLAKVEEVTQQKNLTVLFSTHSATLVKSAEKRRLIYLQNDGTGKINTIYSPFPALILGDIASNDELLSDFVFYVEDDQARTYLRALIGLYLANCHRDPANRPLFRIVPVGGWPQVLAMLANADQVLPTHVKRFAFMDADAAPSICDALRDRRQPVLDQHNQVGQNIKYLPCTPEQGLIDYLENEVVGNARRTQELDAAFQGNALGLGNIVRTHGYQQLTSANPRDQAKKRLTFLLDKLAPATGLDKAHIKRILFGKFCTDRNIAPYRELQQMFGPIFNAR